MARELAALDTTNISTFKMDRQIAKGMFLGIVEQNNLTMLKTCLTDVHELKKNIFGGVKLIEKLDSWDIENGFKEIAQAFDTVPALLTDCSQID